MTVDKEEFARQEAELDELYREIIIDHYRSPRNRGKLPSPTVSREGFNPLCGDEITLDLSVADGVIVDVRYDGQGCSISQSSASMLTDAVKGKELEEARSLFRRFQAMMVGSGVADPEELGDLEALSGVRKFPVRVKCATLAWHTLDEALESLLQGKS
ncbi:MAG: SUF system NifU family Fe-S cluster assembly protein [Chloroflexi bacterium]|nr:SUF system NifU family Fe-S cluster assembly protein [Chloroflexota bacterium]